MVRSPFPPGSLHLTWFGTTPGLWIDRPEATARDVHQVAVDVIGADVRSALAGHFTTHPLFDEQAPTPEIEAVEVDVINLVEAIVGRRPTPSWSASLGWLHHATMLAVETAASSRVMPQLRTAGLRWSAVWTPILDAPVETMLEDLTALAPSVVLAGSDKPTASQVNRIFSSIVDALCRLGLDQSDWRPPLPRTRATGVVALRRIATALSNPDPIFLGDSVAHETAFAEWATQLSDYSHTTSGGPDVSLRGRLVAPAEDPGDWTLFLEALSPDGTVTSFEQIWSGGEEAQKLGNETALVALRRRMRQLIDRITSQLELFSPLLEDPAPNELSLDLNDVAELLGDGIELCRIAGLVIDEPGSLRALKPRLTARASSKRDLGGFARTLVDVDWGIALGDITLTPEEIEGLAQTSAEVVALRGDWYHIDRRSINRTLDRLATQRRDSAELTPAELLRRAASELDPTQDESLTAEGWFATLLEGLPDDELTEAHEPPGFVGELRPYQRRALSWLQFLGRLDLGGCLADDMGLGKTPTALAHLLRRTLDRVSADQPRLAHLVICPLSVVTNWQSEAERFAPELSVKIIHGPDRPRGEDLIRAAANHDVLITTYGTASRITSELEPIPFDVVVCDEAQAIKNHRTNAAITIRELDSRQRIGLTGTPVENRLTELWAILDAMNPGMLGGVSWFKRTFANPIETDGDEDALASLRRITSPFVLRRTKADRSLVMELPDKVEQVAWAVLTPEQAGLYQAVLDDFFQRSEELSQMERRGLVLATLTKLKQICNHPAHFLSEDEVGASGRSGKLARLDELVSTLLEADERALVFTQYRAMGTLLSDHLEKEYGFAVPFLHGGKTLGQRSEMVERFQSGDGPPIQLISLRAGGTGLNLTAASRVIHFDRWWNPAVEDQATDRTWRIGQDKTVFVHKLVCQGTLEETIDSLLTEKRALASSVIRSDDGWLTELSTDELRNALTLGANAVGERAEAEVR